MNKKVVWAVAVLQVLLLCFIAAKREWIRSSGAVVYVRTAPVDPRDLFRGDYVQLEYDIAFPSKDIVDSFLHLNKSIAEEKSNNRKQHVVYLTLDSFSGTGVVEPKKLLLEEPVEGLFIKGRFGGRLWRNWRQGGLLKFGIEKYFIEQGTGFDLEEKRGNRDEWQTPMEMEVALGTDGTAVIKGHRWGDLGVRLEVTIPGERRNRQRNETETDAVTRRSPAVKVSLRNQSDKPVNLLVSENDFCEFKLIKNTRRRDFKGYEVLEFPNRDCSNFNTQSFSVKNLAPNAIHTIEVDLADSQWHVKQKGEKIEIADLPDAWSGFRWIYQPPRLNNHEYENLWQSSMKTALFRTSGRID